MVELGEALKRGEMPPELVHLLGNVNPGVGPDGKPVIDKEGGAVIQPTAGFVVKTRAPQVGKVFVNMTSHEFVDSFERKHIPK